MSIDKVSGLHYVLMVRIVRNKANPSNPLDNIRHRWGDPGSQEKADMLGILYACKHLWHNAFDFA